MLLWLMATIAVASIVAFAALLVYARRAAKRHTADVFAVEQELAERASMPTDTARASADCLIATHAAREPWDRDVGQAVIGELTTLAPDIKALLTAQKRLVFAGDLLLSAEYMGSSDTRLPAGMSQIGSADDGEYAVCAYQDGRPEVVSLRVSDGRHEMSFASIHHCISVLADPDLGKRSSG